MSKKGAVLCDKCIDRKRGEMELKRQGDVADLRARNLEFERQIIQLKDELERLKRENVAALDKARSELSGTQIHDLQQAQARVAEMERIVHEKESIVSKLQIEKAGLAKLVAELRRETSTLSHAHILIKQTEEQNRLDLERVSLANDQLKRQNQELTAQLSTLEAEADTPPDVAPPLPPLNRRPSLEPEIYPPHQVLAIPSHPQRVSAPGELPESIDDLEPPEDSLYVEPEQDDNVPVETKIIAPTPVEAEPRPSSPQRSYAAVASAVASSAVTSIASVAAGAIANAVARELTGEIGRATSRLSSSHVPRVAHGHTPQTHHSPHGSSGARSTPPSSSHASRVAAQSFTQVSRVSKPPPLGGGRDAARSVPPARARGADRFKHVVVTDLEARESDASKKNSLPAGGKR